MIELRTHRTAIVEYNSENMSDNLNIKIESTKRRVNLYNEEKRGQMIDVQCKFLYFT